MKLQDSLFFVLLIALFIFTVNGGCGKEPAVQSVEDTPTTTVQASRDEAAFEPVKPFVDPTAVEIRSDGCRVREYTVRSTQNGNEYTLRLQVNPSDSCELIWRVTDQLYLLAMRAESLDVLLDSPDGSLVQTGSGRWGDEDGNMKSALVYFSPPGELGAMAQELVPINRDFRLRIRANGDFPVVTTISMGFMAPVAN